MTVLIVTIRTEKHTTDLVISPLHVISNKIYSTPLENYLEEKKNKINISLSQISQITFKSNHSFIFLQPKTQLLIGF